MLISWNCTVTGLEMALLHRLTHYLPLHSSLCRELHDLAALKSACMAWLEDLQFSPFSLILMALL